MKLFDVIYQTQKTVFHHISKDLDESWQYDALIKITFPNYGHGYDFFLF